MDGALGELNSTACTSPPTPTVSFLIQKQTGSRRNDLVLKVVQTEQIIGVGSKVTSGKTCLSLPVFTGSPANWELTIYVRKGPREFASSNLYRHKEGLFWISAQIAGNWRSGESRQEKTENVLVVFVFWSL